MFPTGAYDDATVKRIAMASHGMSVVKVKRGRVPGSWLVVDPGSSRQNRRITASTPMRVTGPAVGDPRLRTAADPSGRTVLGTLNNCAGGMTPWGTVLSGEENFNGYFDASGELDARYATSYARYGITGKGRGWNEVDPRFDLTTEPHEPFRFGWIVEVDPLKPDSTPRKHSMLGRFKHEGANVAIAPNGRAVVYMGDDERGDYMYKFVSRDRYEDSGRKGARKHNLTLLQHGTLFVARFTGDGTEDGEYDGTGEWIPLASDTTSFVEGMSVADVLDRHPPGGRQGLAHPDGPPRGRRAEPGERQGLRRPHQQRPARDHAPRRRGQPARHLHDPAGAGRAVDAPGGEPQRLRPGADPGRGQPRVRTFGWDLMLVCGDPAAQETYFAGFDKSRVSPISCPDNVAFDREGNLWISTDGNVLGSNDGVFRVPVAGPSRGHVQQFLTVPRGAEACGPLLTRDSRSLFVAVQHPGEVDGATFESPASTWPHSDDFPRPSVCVAYRTR